MQTEIVAIIMYEGKVKSGGYAKYNIAQVLNDNLPGMMHIIKEKLLPFPSPNAPIQRLTLK